MSNVSIEQAIFQAAILIADPDQRADYLDVACQGDAELRARIAELLTAEGDDDFMRHRAIDSIINQPTRPPSPDVTIGAEPTSRRVGSYKLLEQIGEGGFGTVYMAEQESPVRRRVALKIIKPGMDTRQVIARFEAERQALAMMDHPNIAKVFEAGSTDQERPYFVMELVRGVPVTDYCDANNLTTSERLELFVDVCGAIQHAHQKGIIHRDIKPNNIMITVIDDQAIPKVIDFGIAKATQQPLTDKTLFTAYAQLVGTPTYMSPEQAQLSGNDVDTRSDIYSMGVLLYELLVGAPPFETAELRQQGYEEMCRRIREDDPPIPSTRLSTLTRAQQATLAARRRSETSKLRKQLRGELDWIVMKALEKDRRRRYATASALADDVRRHLRGEPVAAVPPSAMYRIQKYVKRHRIVVLTTIVVACALLAGTIASTIGLWHAVRARKDAEQARGSLSDQLQVTRAAQAQANLSLYVSDMNRAYQAYDDADVRLARLILDRYQESYANNFEWRCLRWLCETGDALHTINDHSTIVNAVAISQDGVLASCAADGSCRLHRLDTRKEIRHWRHSVAIRCLDFSPDGQILATGDAQGQLDLWQLQPWSLMKTLEVSADSIADVRFSPQGKTLAVSLGGAASVEIWDWDQAQLLSTIGDGAPTRLEFSPNGHHLAGAGPGQAVYLWDLHQPPAELYARAPRAHTSFASDVSFSRPAGRHLATSSWDTVIKLWDVSELRRAEVEQRSAGDLSTFRGHRGWIRALEFSPDGSYLASAGIDNSIRLWPGRPPWKSIQDPLETLRGHFAAVRDLAFSPDGNTLVSAGEDRTIKLWPGREGPAANVLLGHDVWVFDVAFSPDGKTLASGAFDGEVRLWNTTTQGLDFAKKLHDHQVFRVVFSPDGCLLASCDGVWRRDARAGINFSTPGVVRLLNLADKTDETIDLPQKAGVRALDFSPDGNSLGIGDHNGWLWVWDVARRDVQNSIHVGSGIIDSLGYSPNGTVIAVSFWNVGKNKRELVCYSANDLQEVSRFGAEYSGAWRLSFAPASLGSDLLATASARGVDFFDVRDRRKVDHWDGHNNNVIGISYSPDGKTLATSGTDHTIRLWNIESGKEVAKLMGHRGIVSGLTFSCDGKMLASSGEDKSIRIWRTIHDSDARDRHRSSKANR